MKRAPRPFHLPFPGLLVFALGALGCGGRDSSGTGGASGRASTGAVTTPGEGSSRPRGLVVLAQRYPNGDVFPSVEERQDEQVRLHKNILVETLVGGTWGDVDVRGLTLRASCDTPEVDCVELGRGGALRPPAWSGRVGMGQCVRVGEGAAVAAGVYRFVVTTCEGEHRVTSEPFVIAY